MDSDCRRYVGFQLEPPEYTYRSPFHAVEQQV